MTAWFQLQSIGIKNVEPYAFAQRFYNYQEK